MSVEEEKAGSEEEEEELGVVEVDFLDDVVVPALFLRSEECFGEVEEGLAEGVGLSSAAGLPGADPDDLTALCSEEKRFWC